jgi:basic membrane protein A
MIGVDVDQSYLSDYVLTSAIKMMGNAVYESLVDYKNNDFASGTVLLGVKEGGSGLSSFESSKFENFTKEQYDAIVSKISDGDIVVPKNYDQLVTFLTDLGYSTGDYPTKATVEPAQ